MNTRSSVNMLFVGAQVLKKLHHTHCFPVKFYQENGRYDVQVSS